MLPVNVSVSVKWYRVLADAELPLNERYGQQTFLSHSACMVCVIILKERLHHLFGLPIIVVMSQRQLVICFQWMLAAVSGDSHAIVFRSKLVLCD